MMATTDAIPPSLIQRYQAGTLQPSSSSEADQNEEHQSALTKATLASESLLVSPSDDDSSSPHDLLTLRTASHTLSEENKDAKTRVAAIKAQVDEARLQLENRRLEERELMEEIRRESGE